MSSEEARPSQVYNKRKIFYVHLYQAGLTIKVHFFMDRWEAVLSLLVRNSQRVSMILNAQFQDEIFDVLSICLESCLSLTAMACSKYFVS